MEEISVIIPVYNVEPYLPDCLDSVRKQNGTLLEILLIDDGSTDNSGQICDQYAQKDPRIRVIHQDNRGLGAARNRGIQEAKGAYLLFVDSDDLIEPDMAHRLAQEATCHHADMVVCEAHRIDDSGAIVGRLDNQLPTGTVLTLQDTPQILLAPHVAWNKLYRRSLFRDNGIQYPEGIWYEDFPTTIQLYSQAKRIVFIKDALYRYRQRQGSIQSCANPARLRDKISGMQAILTYYRAQGLWEQFYSELEYLAIANVYFFPSIELIRKKQCPAYLQELADEIRREFPHYAQNIYLRQLDRAKRLAFWLLEHKLYRLIFSLFDMKEKFCR